MAANATSFQPGNVAALKHGGRSRRVRESVRKELAQELRDLVVTTYPHLESHALLLDLLVDALADVRQLRDYINQQGGPVSPRGHLYKPLDMLRARERDVRQLATDLLISPRAVAQLGQAAGLREPSFAAQLAAKRAQLVLEGKAV